MLHSRKNLSCSFLKLPLLCLISGLIPLGALAQTPTEAKAVKQRETQIETILSQLTLEEKIDLIAGSGFGTRPLPRLGIPAFQMSDGPVGVRSPGPSTAFAAGIGLAATWDTELAAKVGKQIGRDGRARGSHFLLGPGVNLYRSPLNGRNFEYFGEDPYLGAQIAVGYIEGVQSQNVSATIKHFLGNNSEYARNSSDSIIDERTLREIYLPIFEAAVKQAKVGAVMDSYNLVNGTYMTSNRYFNTDILKTQWGFQGVLMSDWFATHDTLGDANSGMDLEMPFGRFLNRQTLLPAIQQGKVTQATIDDKVRRILRTASRFDWMSKPQLDTSIPRFNQQGRAVALENAQKAMVLLKNDGSLLPLDKKQTLKIAVIGPNAFPAVPTAGGSGAVVPYSGDSVFAGVSNALGTEGSVTHLRGIPTLTQMASATRFTTTPDGTTQGLTTEIFANAELRGSPVSTRTDRAVSMGRSFFAAMADSAPGGMESDNPPLSAAPPKQVSMRWTGYYRPQAAGTYALFVEATDSFRLIVDDKTVLDGTQTVKAMLNQTRLELTAEPHKIVLEYRKVSPMGAPFVHLGIVSESGVIDPQVKQFAAQADVAIVVVGFNPETELEGSDRDFALPIAQDELIRTVAAANKKTIVVLNAGGSVDVTPWLDRVPAVVAAWYPGQEGGTAFADVLFGNVTPSGRLPISWERKLEDNPSSATYYYTQAGTKKIEYKEGIFTGYRGYEQKGIKPLFPFGFGLSYTTFRYGKIAVKPLREGSGTVPSYEISFDVTNTGRRAGSDTAQVYVADNHAKVARPKKELKGFARVTLNPGQTKRVKILLNGRAFTYYDVTAKNWHADTGNFEILIGRSSEQIELKATLNLPTPLNIAVGD